MAAADALVLFDIDGTLIRRAGPHHKLALIDAVREVTGLETTLDRVDTTGQLDRDLIRLMLRNAGASDAHIDTAMRSIVRLAQDIYRQARPNLRRRVCPGVRGALRKLHGSRIPMGLVTGNLTAIGWRKMEHCGLLRFFRFGAFAEQAATRAGLVEIAIYQARRAGWLRRETTVSLVGDHPNDIRAAKLNGVRSIAVATGVVPRAQLATHSPDLLLSDLRCMKLEMFL
ncbi:MAG: HAD hydrolase-like protein [Bryobacteraceae bacterium]|nr:HAD hydrolase-like protein [Bryobacteraceae bacterium]